jgi:predicted ATP-dependent endonuclease of OLD family
MKLVEMRISNFRSLGGNGNVIRFSQSDIIFLIGQNDVGKSSVLEAYEYFINAKQKAELTDFFQYNEANTIVLEGDFEIEDSDSSDKDLNKEPEWTKKWIQKSNGLITIKKVCDKSGSEFKKFTKTSDGEWNEGGFGGFDTIFKKYAPEPIKINAIETIESLEKKVNEIIEKECIKKLNETNPTEYEAAVKALQKLQDIASSTTSISTYNTNINKTFQKVFPNLELKISVKDPEGVEPEKAIKSCHSIDVLKTGVDRKELFSQHGNGVIRQALFNFIAFLKTTTSETRKQYLVMFEEPELYLHPKSERLLREQLYELANNSPFQILCATHSAQMIDISKPHASLVRITKDANESTFTHQVGHTLFQNDAFKDFVQMVNRFNPNVCEAFYATKVILVEGDTEAIICREYLKDKYKDLDIFVLNTGSKNNIPFFQEILNHFCIDYAVFHDSDTRFVYEDRNKGIIKLNKDGSSKKNSAWALNSSISEKLDTKNTNVAKRWVSIFDFESFNQYEIDWDIGKPMSAYNFYKLNKTKSLPIFTMIENFINNEPGQTQEYIDKIEEPKKA